MVSAAELRDLRRQTTTPLRAFVNSGEPATVDEWSAAFGSLPAPPLRLATHRLFDAKAHPDRIVMLVRTPADALWSYFHYRSSHRGDFDGSLDEFLEDNGSGIPALARWYNSWEPLRERSVVISYEELRNDPGTNLRRALEGLDCQTSVDPNVIAERWDFARRQKSEIENTGVPTGSNGLFIRSGAIGEGRANFDESQLTRLDEELRRRLTAEAATWMRSLGYLSD